MTGPADESIYGEEYFEYGIAKGISNYERYRWLPERSFREAHQYVELAAHRKGALILDYGCAKGFLVRAFCEMGFDAYGCDISEYAIACADRFVRNRLSLIGKELTVSTVGRDFALVVCSHVLEHLPGEEVALVIRRLHGFASRVAVTVPVGQNGGFWNPKHNKDLTHSTIEPPSWWLQQFQKAGARVTSTHVIRWHWGRPDVISIISEEPKHLCRPTRLFQRNAKSRARRKAALKVSLRNSIFYKPAFVTA